MWKHCWAGRTMRAAPHSTTPADWVSMTQWRTCWASRGRTAWLASPRTRSLSCILLLSEFSRSQKRCLLCARERSNFRLSLKFTPSFPLWSKWCQQCCCCWQWLMSNAVNKLLHWTWHDVLKPRSCYIHIPITTCLTVLLSLSASQNLLVLQVQLHRQLNVLVSL